MEVERQDPRCKEIVKAPSLAEYLARSVPKKIYISQRAHRWRESYPLQEPCQ